MFGINYRYQLNEEKGTIKLAPTKGVLIIGSVMTLVYVAAAAVALAPAKPAEVVELDEKFNKNV